MTDHDINGPGTANYSPAYAKPDDVIMFRTRSKRGMDAAGNVGSGPVPTELMPPDPAVGGEMGQFSVLGWSDGFGAFRRLSSFTGRVITLRSMGANPAVGPVGRSNRQARLRARIKALTTDYTPSSQAVVKEVEDNG